MRGAKRFLQSASPAFPARFLAAVENQNLDEVVHLHDPIEDDPTMQEIMAKVDNLVREELKMVRMQRGLCHRRWKMKKQILQEQFSVEWFSPAEMNPHTKFD